MKKIKVHGWAQDNAGSYHQAGAVLTVDDSGGEGCIGEKAAKAMIATHSASEHHDKHKAPAAPAA